MLIEILASVTVTIGGVERPDGMLYVQLCDSETFLTDSCRYQAVLEPDAGEAVFGDVPPGRWAASVWHDVDGDGEMATNLFGVPSEPVAMSNAPRAMFGPPSFKDAAFEVGADPVSVNVDLAR